MPGGSRTRRNNESAITMNRDRCCVARRVTACQTPQMFDILQPGNRGPAGGTEEIRRGEGERSARSITSGEVVTSQTASRGVLFDMVTAYARCESSAFPGAKAVLIGGRNQ